MNIKLAEKKGQFLNWKNQKLLNFQTKHFTLTYGSFIEEYNK